MPDKYKIEYFLLVFLGKIFGALSFISLKLSSSVLAFIIYHLLGIRKKVVKKNLRIAFPEISPSELKKLAFSNYKSLAVTVIEIFRMENISSEELKNSLSTEGFEIVKEKFAEDKGLILLTGHFGNWELAAVATGLILNEKISVLVKKQKNVFVADKLTKIRERFGNVEITLGTTVRELYKAVREKKIVGIVGDQRGTRDSVRVDFFGRKTFTFPGTAAIALRTGCPVIVMLGARQSDGIYKAIFTEIKHREYEGTEEQKIEKFNRDYMHALENAIKEYPEQWFWMHNIWKY